MDISSSILLISSLARRRFSWWWEDDKDKALTIYKYLDTKHRPLLLLTSVSLSHLSAFPGLFDAIEHWAELGQPLPVHCSHTLHVLLQTKPVG